MQKFKDICNSQSTIYQLIRYTFVGGIAFVADYGLLYFFTEYVGFPYLFSAAISFVVGLAVNYTLCNVIVFTTHKLQNKLLEFAIFAVIGIIGLGINEFVLLACTEWAGLHYMLSKLVSTIIVFFWNFFARKFTLFVKK